jgi:hypothetical protein
MDVENEEDFVDSDLLESTSTLQEMQQSPSSDDTCFRKPAPAAHKSTRNGPTFTRGRCRSNDSGFVQPRWTPYPKSSGSNAASLRTENESTQASSLPPSSGTCSALDMDGFEIAPATAKKLERYRFTPSPEKAIPVIALPPPPPEDFEDGDVGAPIDLTENTCSDEEGLGYSPLSRKDILKNIKSSQLQTSPRGMAMNDDPCIGFEEPANLSILSRKASTGGNSTIKEEQRHSSDSVDLTKCSEALDDTMGLEPKAEAGPEAEKVEEPEAPLSDEQQKVLQMVLEG